MCHTAKGSTISKQMWRVNAFVNKYAGLKGINAINWQNVKLHFFLSICTICVLIYICRVTRELDDDIKYVFLAKPRVVSARILSMWKRLDSSAAAAVSASPSALAKLLAPECEHTCRFTAREMPEQSTWHLRSVYLNLGEIKCNRLSLPRTVTHSCIMAGVSERCGTQNQTACARLRSLKIAAVECRFLILKGHRRL